MKKISHFIDGRIYSSSKSRIGAIFNPASNISFSGNNSHSGTETFTGTVNLNGTNNAAGLTLSSG